MRNRKVAFVLNDEEYQQLQEQSSLCGLSKGSYLRGLIMKNHLRPLPTEDQKQLAKQLSGIGSDINRMARATVRRGYALPDDWKEIREILDHLWRVYYGNY